MSRKQRHQVEKGTLYAVEMPEWHVDCAEPGCDAATFMLPSMTADTRKEAEQYIAKNGSEADEGWRLEGGRWYCPKHSET